MTLNYEPDNTGIAVYTTGLAKGLATRGLMVTVVSAAPHYPAWRTAPRSEWASDEVSDGVHVLRFQSYVPCRPTLTRRALFELLYGVRFVSSLAVRRELRASDSLVLVTPALLTSAIVRLWLSTCRARPRILLWVQDRYGPGLREVGGRAGVASRVIGAVEGALARACDQIVVIHDRWRRVVSKDLGVDQARVATVRNWTHIVPHPKVDFLAVRRSFGWGNPDEEAVVLHAGNMGAKQGLENVVAAARYAQENRLPLRFVLLGDGSRRKQLEVEARGCANLQFVRPLPDDEYLAVLGAADVLLVNEIPGLAETAVPSKLTSYFATGRPILAATEETSVTAEEIRASGAGCIVNPGEPEALANGAMKLFHKRVDSHAGPRYVECCLSEDTALSRFLDLVSPQGACLNCLEDQPRRAASA